MNKKSNNLKKGNYIIKNKEKLLHIRKNKKRFRGLMLLVIIMMSTLITLCIKLPYFNITSINSIGNVNVTKAQINEIFNSHLGSNILYDSFNYSKKQIMKNPYVLSAKVKKVMPNKVVVEIEEKVAMFYGKVGNTYYIIDSKGFLLEKRSNIKDMNLVNLIGLDYEKYEVGNVVGIKDDRKISIVTQLTNLIDDYRRTNSNNITMVDVSNVLDVKLFTGEMCIKFGTTEDLDKKFNKAINIITQPQYKGAKGYVDVSFNGNPVIFVKK